MAAAMEHINRRKKEQHRTVNTTYTQEKNN